MGLASGVIAVSAVLTAATFMALVFTSGPGLLLYLAMLGDAAVWLLPGLLVQALPLGLFGGVLLAADRPRAEDAIRPRNILGLALLLTMVTLGLTGWIIPEGYRATAAIGDRFTTSATVERRTEPSAAARNATTPAAALDLPQLLKNPSPETNAHLLRRLRPVVGCMLAGAAAAGLVAVGWRPRSSRVIALTTAMFFVQMFLWKP